MKRFLLLIAAVAVILSSCQKINNELDALDKRLDKLEQETIPSIDEQIAAINVSLDNLNAMDKELKGYIDNLTATATSLQEQINSTNTKIEEVKAALQGEISTAKADILAQLDAVKTELDNELAQINGTIVILQAKDAELEGKIAELNAYINTELSKTTDWVSATFATLEQYNALVSEIATIKEQIKAINQSIADLETRLTTKINEGIATAVSTLNADIQQKVKEITEAYTAAIKTAKEEITSAYTSAIQNAINALDVTLKAWMGEQLAGYYTIAEVEALLATLEQEVNNKIDAQKAYLESLIGELSATTAKSIADNKLLIDALRSDMASLQGESASNAVKIVENSTAIAQNAQDIIDNAAAIANNSDNIEANEQLIANIKPLIDANTNAVADNKRAIDALRISTSSIIATNAENIATNAENIAKSSTLISKNAAAIANNQLAISQNAADILQLQQHFASIESEFEEICQRIIREAISNNGTISSSEALALNTRIENEISTFNYQIALISTRVSVLENEVATIKQQIANILSDVANLKDSISKLLARIQSISYIPKYEDGKATIEHNGTMSKVVLDFEISPKSAVSELANVWRTAVSIQAVYTHTRAVSFVDMPILSFYADTYNGAITIVASGEKLSEEFFAGSQTASARLSISDGNNSVVSGYIPLEIQSVMEYTTYNKEIVIPSASPEFEIISNTYEKGVGKMVFAGRLTKITTQLFNNCTTLTSVTIPVSVRSIEQQAFQKCSKLSIVYVHPITPPALGSGVFTNASSDLVIHVPYMSIDAYKRCWSAYKSKIHDPSIANNTIYYTTSDGEIVTNNDFEYSSVLFGANIVSNTYENGQGIITFDSDVTFIGVGAFQYSATLTSLIIPRSVKTIYNHAFYECSSLTKIDCYAAEPPILGDYDEEDETWRIDYSEWDQITIYVPASLVNTYKTNENWRSLSDNIVGL